MTIRRSARRSSSPNRSCLLLWRMPRDPLQLPGRPQTLFFSLSVHRGTETGLVYCAGPGLPTIISGVKKLKLFPTKRHLRPKYKADMTLYGINGPDQVIGAVLPWFGRHRVAHYAIPGPTTSDFSRRISTGREKVSHPRQPRVIYDSGKYINKGLAADKTGGRGQK